MPVELNHIILRSRDKAASATWLAGLLGLDPPRPVGPFMAVALSNGVTLDYDDPAGADIESQHCAFLVTDAELDAIFERVTRAGITHYADARHTRPGEVNTRNGGRGFYFEDPDGHNLEVFTKVPLA